MALTLALSGGHRQEGSTLPFSHGLPYLRLPMSVSSCPANPAQPTSSRKPDSARIILQSLELFSQSSNPPVDSTLVCDICDYCPLLSPIEPEKK